MKRHLPGLLFSASLGLLCAGFPMVLPDGGRSSIGRARNIPRLQVRVLPATFQPLADAELARAVIFKAAERNGIAPRAWQLQNVAWRESRLNPYAFNDKSGAMGLFQFKPATWSFAVHKMGRLHLNPWRMEDNAEAAAWMWAHGYANHWGMEP